VSAGGGHTVLLKSDGGVVACGYDGNGRCTIPLLPDGVTYSQVSAGDVHTVLLKSDGGVVACGSNGSGQCNIAVLPDGVTYSQVSAGGGHTVLLKSDGGVVACGSNDNDQCNIPSLYIAVKYVPDACFPLIAGQICVLQLSFCKDGDGNAVSIVCTSLNGESLCTLAVNDSDAILDVRLKIAEEVAVPEHRLRLVLPNGNLYSSVDATAQVNELLSMKR